jgi:hypothetical protein
VASLVLSRAEFLVVLDILHSEHIFGLENSALFPADKDAHLELIDQGIQQLKERGLVRIEDGHHIIEHRLLEIGVIVTRPQVVITTIRDRTGIGGQLYLHYQAQNDVVEMMLPDENHYSLGQLPDIATAMDRLVRILDLPDGDCPFSKPQSIERDHLYHVKTRLESADRAGAMIGLTKLGWPEPYAAAFLDVLAGQQAAGLINLMAPDGDRPEDRLGVMRDLTLIRDRKTAWLLVPEPHNHDSLLAGQINAEAFRTALEIAYYAVSRRNQEQH